MLIEIFCAIAALVCVIINIILLFVKDAPKMVCVFGILFGLYALLSSVSLIYKEISPQIKLEQMEIQHSEFGRK